MKEALRIWRVLRPISHIFTDNIVIMYELEKISSDLKNYIEQKGWSLSLADIDVVDERVDRLMQLAQPDFDNYNFYALG